MPACPAESAPRYRPRSASNALKEIVEAEARPKRERRRGRRDRAPAEGWSVPRPGPGGSRVARDRRALEDLLRLWDERFLKDHGPLHPRIRDLMEAFVRCGDPHFGFLRLKCVEAECPTKTERIVPFSCKTRALCPSCSKKRALLWAERMVDDVLPKVPYVQLVFTIPKIFRKAFLFKRSLHGALSRAAYAATKDFFTEHFRAIEGAVPAMVVAPQSFGSLLNFHPHWHAISSMGVFDKTGSFHPAPSDLDFSPLVTLFRERAFKALLECEATTEDRVTLVRSWVHSGFNIDSSRRLDAEDRKGLQSLLEYMERAPVSLERLEYRSDKLVHYRGNYHPGLGRDHQPEETTSFSRRSISWRSWFPTCFCATKLQFARTERCRQRSEGASAGSKKAFHLPRA